MDSHHKVELTGDSEGNIPAELMAELQREVARNNEAVRIVKEREQQAIEAKDRAAESHRRMHEMMHRYEQMRQKLEWTRITLAQTSTQIAKHDTARADKIRATVTLLKERTENYREKLNQYCNTNKDKTATTEQTLGEDTLKEGIGDDGGLTDSEKMLLQMCQDQHRQMLEQSTLAIMKGEKNKLHSTSEEATDDTHLSTTTESLETLPVEENTPSSSAPNENQIEETQETLKAVTLQIDNSKTAEQPINEDHDHQNNSVTPNKPEIDASPAAATPQISDVQEDFDVKEITKDLNETVCNIEAKCAGVREELGQMAMSEQYMRTKQAQLLAKRRENEAQRALEMAAEREKEALEMRQKVADMMKLLDERRAKLKATENVVEKKGNVVDKVTKLLDSKHRRADFVQKQRDECLVFDVSHKKELPKTSNYKTNETNDEEYSKQEEQQQENDEQQCSMDIDSEQDKKDINIDSSKVEEKQEEKQQEEDSKNLEIEPNKKED